MLKGNKLRCYPNATQREQLAQMFGNQRFVWNQMLNMLNKRHENNAYALFPTAYGLNYMLKALKQEYPFLKESLSQALQMDCEALREAFIRMFKHISGHPKFKSRKCHYQSFTGKQGCSVAAKYYLKVPKLGYLKVSRTDTIVGHPIKRFTVKVTPTGKYYVSVNYESENQTLKQIGKQVGVDLNTGELAVLSDGVRIPTLNLKPLERKLRVEQRKLSRRYERTKIERAHDKITCPDNVRELADFSNYQRQRCLVARLNAKIKHKRQNYLQQVTTWLVCHYDTIVIEDLKVSNMVKNHHLARKIEHQSWYEFRRGLTYKCAWYGRQLIVVDPKNTSRICSKCGKKNYQFDELDTNQWLSTRQWDCPYCGAHHDRDINAAQNILNKGLASAN